MMTDEALRKLARNHLDTDADLVAGVLWSNKGTVDDLVRALEAGGDNTIRERMAALLLGNKNPTWTDVAGDWLRRHQAATKAQAERALSRPVLADVLRPQTSPPQGVPIDSICLADGEAWDPLGVGFCVVRLGPDGWGPLS